MTCWAARTRCKDSSKRLLELAHNCVDGKVWWEADVAKLTTKCNFNVMRAFPPSSKLQFLVGGELGQIAFDPHSVQFRWAGGGQITVEGDLEHVDENGVTHFYECTAHSGPPLLLHRLIQKRVITLDVSPFCLTLKFEDGQLLRLKSGEGPYEDGLIQPTATLADGWIVY